MAGKPDILHETLLQGVANATELAMQQTAVTFWWVRLAFCMQAACMTAPADATGLTLVRLLLLRKQLNLILLSLEGQNTHFSHISLH